MTFIKVHSRGLWHGIHPTRLVNTNMITDVCPLLRTKGTTITMIGDQSFDVEETFEEVEKLING